jgi:hypothetical protein
MTRRSSSPQELLPHDVDTYYAERSVLPSRFHKNQIFINGYTAKGEKFEVKKQNKNSKNSRLKMTTMDE